MIRPASLRRTGIGAAALVFVFLTGRYIAEQGPVRLTRPVTVLSLSHPAQRADEAYLVYLARLRTRLPRGSSVIVLSPKSAAEPSSGPSYLIALGQLPEHDVLPWTVLREPSFPPPRFVASFRRGFHDPRYRVVEEGPESILFERTP